MNCKKIFENLLSDKGPTYRMHKEHLKLTKENNPTSETGQISEQTLYQRRYTAGLPAQYHLY